MNSTNLLRRFLTALALISAASLALAAAPLSIKTTSLPGGTVGSAYSATLSATGGRTPYTWSLSAGTIPAGLALNASTGVISGTPTAVGTSAITIKVTDAAKTTSSVALSLAVAPSVALAPRAAAVRVGTVLTLTISTSDPAGVQLSASNGSLSATSALNGAAVAWTAPAVAGSYSITATSQSNSKQSATTTVGVTDLAAVATWHNDLARSGANTREYALTTSNVTSGSFGKRFSCPVDGAVYGQPLWVGGVNIGGTVRNIVLVTTQHESVYAFDADAASCVALWQASLVDATAHGANAGEHSVPSCTIGTTTALVGAGYCDISPEVGITGTPVIDAATGTLYVVAKSVDATPTFYQRLHALDITTGAEKLGGPQLISGSAVSNQHGTVTFSPQQQHQRSGLALSGGYVYVTWAAHEDKTPYYGWVMAFDATTLAPAGVFNTAPDAGMGGVWMGGGGPAIDANSRIFVVTGNATFNATSPTMPYSDYGDSVLQLSQFGTSSFALNGYFTPSNQATDNSTDADLGSGGLALLDLPANGTVPAQQLVVGGGKDGYLNVLNRANLGGYTNSFVQRFNSGYPLYSTGAVWNGMFFLGGSGGPLQAFPYSAAVAPFSTTRTSASAGTFGFPGTSPSVSSTPSFTNGIVWALDNSLYCSKQSKGCGPAVLHAYDATNLGRELWNSAQVTGNAAGYAVKFSVPTVANGRVYVGTRGLNNGTTGTPSGQLDVYGLLP